MKQLFTTLIVIVMLSGAGSATKVNASDRGIWRGGSMYSHYGLGLPVDFRATHADGMGVYGVALHDSRLSSITNPATWSRTVVTNAGGVFEVKSYDATSGPNQSSSTRFQAGPFQLVLPVSQDRIGISFSVSPLTAARYNTMNEKLLAPDENNTDNTLSYVVETEGNGGINKIETGVGIRLTPSISVGYAPSLMIGTINRNQTVFFDHVDYEQVNLQESTSHYGFGNRFGMFFSTNDAFRDNDRIALGATLSLPVNFVSERTLKSRIDQRDVTIYPTDFYGDGQVTFPLETSAGFSYNLSPYFLISTDMLYQKWSDYKNFHGDSEPFLKDRFRWGFGSQYLAARRAGTTFFSNFIYRLGVSYDTGSLKLNETDITTLSFHTGLGIPSSRTNSSIDINAELGFRGTEASDLISERIFALKISFNLTELMFIQRRLQ